MTTYKGNYAGIGQMLRSEMVAGAVELTAAKIMAAYVAMAPVGDPAEGDDTPGTLKASMSLVRRYQRDGRVVVDVVSSDPHFLAKEFGSKRRTRNGVVIVEGAHVMAKAIGAARF